MSIKTTVQHLWTRYMCAEGMDAKVERIKQQRIDDIKAAVILLEAMRLWEKETKT